MELASQHIIDDSTNGGSPKWMVYNGKSIYKWLFRGTPPIYGNLHMHTVYRLHIVL